MPRCGWQLRSISKQQDGNFLLSYDTPDGQKQVKARSVALTAPAYVASDMLQQQCPAAAQQLKSIDYPPVSAVTLAYPMSAIRDDRKDEKGAVPGSN